MRLFVFARHAESAANTEHLLSSDPARPIRLTPCGRRQAQRLGEQIANLEIERAVCTRFLRTQQTVEIALLGRGVPVAVEASLDEVRAGAFDGAPIQAYRARRQQHARSERFPLGESLDDAVRRYADALRRLLQRTEAITLIVSHELAVRCIADAATPGRVPDRSEFGIPNAVPYLFDEHGLRRAVDTFADLTPVGRAHKAA